MIPGTDINNNIDRNCELRSSLKEEEERERKLTPRKSHLIFLRNKEKIEVLTHRSHVDDKRSKEKQHVT